MAEVPVSGSVLTWAREFRGLSLDAAAKRLGLTKLELQEFEAEIRKPSLTKFEKIVATYRLPSATLFRRTPPKEPDKPSDFRTFGGVVPHESFDFHVALSNVRSLQAVLRVLRFEDDNFKSATIRQYDFKGSPFQQADKERHEIGISIQQQLGWKTGEGFRHWRAIVERLGIAVYLQKFEVNDCRGFSLWEDGVTPAIVINKAERSENAWVFTLIHEYAHLLIRRPGISDLNFANPTEAFCNRFAAAFLMPREALQNVLPIWPSEPIAWDHTLIREAAGRLKVSAQALAIRLEELAKAPKDFNQHFVGHGVQKKPTEVGGNYVNTRLSEIGARYTEAVVGALDRDIIDGVHASEALGLSPKHLGAARTYIERQPDLAHAG